MPFESPKGISAGTARLLARLDIADSEFFPDITLQQAATMKLSYAMTAKARHNLNLQVKGVLSSEGVSSILYLGYYGFAYQVATAIGRAGAGESGATAVAVLEDKWTTRGLSAPVLALIRKQVFNLNVPGPALVNEGMTVIGTTAPGDTAELVFDLKNNGGAQAATVTGVLVSGDVGNLTVPDSTGAWPDIIPFETQDNDLNRFSVLVDLLCPPATEVTLTLTVQAAGGYETVIEQIITVG